MLEMQMLHVTSNGTSRVAKSRTGKAWRLSGNRMRTVLLGNCNMDGKT